MRLPENLTAPIIRMTADQTVLIQMVLMPMAVRKIRAVRMGQALTGTEILRGLRDGSDSSQDAYEEYSSDGSEDYNSDGSYSGDSGYGESYYDNEESY